MELHSYAKRRTKPKKWTNEQRRIMVDSRIAYDYMFSKKPRGSMLPWKKILSIAKLDDYNVYFVRKQWSNMVEKYKQYKINRLGHIPTQAIDDEMIEKITAEWEFFAPIHDYMMLKSRNLHSYALQYREEPMLELNSNSNSTQSSTECINLYSSDTNDIPLPNERMSKFTATAHDHNFYSKNWEEEQQTLQEIKTENIAETENDVIIMSEQQQPTVMDLETPAEPIQKQEQELLDNKPHIKPNNALSERDRYYRHKRRFNRRFERRFDAILQVVGQVVKAEYPSIDVSPLMKAASAAVDLGSQISGQIFSSGDEFDDDESDEDKMQKSENNHLTTSTHDTSESRWYVTPQ